MRLNDKYLSSPNARHWKKFYWGIQGYCKQQVRSSSNLHFKSWEYMYMDSVMYDVHFRTTMPSVQVHLNTTDQELLRKLNNSLIIEIKGDPVSFRDSNLNELLYVVIVIMFYGTALMVLIATQIRKQRREGQEVDYYDEYLERNKDDGKKMLLPKIDVKVNVPLEADEIKMEEESFAGKN